MAATSATSSPDSNWVVLSVGPVQHKVRKDTLRKSPKGSPLSSFLGDNKKSGRSYSSSGPTIGSDGLALPYVLHYLATGDLVYPVHEGYPRVDALLTALTELGLVQDVFRKAGSQRKRRQRRREIPVQILSNRNESTSTSSPGSDSLDGASPSPRLTKCRSLIFSAESTQSFSGSSSSSSSSSSSPEPLSIQGGPRSLRMSSSMVALDAPVATTPPTPPVANDRLMAFLRKYLQRAKDTRRSRQKDIMQAYALANNPPMDILSLEEMANRGAPCDTNNANNPRRADNLVFRPPPTRGTTVVAQSTAIRGGSGQELVSMFGEGRVLRRLLPHLPCTRLPDASPHLDSVVTFHVDEHMPFPLENQLSKAGFTLTVTSQWRDPVSGCKKQQWMAYRKNVPPLLRSPRMWRRILRKSTPADFSHANVYRQSHRDASPPPRVVVKSNENVSLFRRVFSLQL